MIWRHIFHVLLRIETEPTDPAIPAIPATHQNMQHGRLMVPIWFYDQENRFSRIRKAIPQQDQTTRKDNLKTYVCSFNSNHREKSGQRRVFAISEQVKEARWPRPVPCNYPLPVTFRIILQGPCGSGARRRWLLPPPRKRQTLPQGSHKVQEPAQPTEAQVGGCACPVADHP